MRRVKTRMIVRGQRSDDSHGIAALTLQHGALSDSPGLRWRLCRNSTCCTCSVRDQDSPNLFERKMNRLALQAYVPKIPRRRHQSSTDWQSGWASPPPAMAAESAPVPRSPPAKCMGRVGLHRLFSALGRPLGADKPVKRLCARCVVELALAHLDIIPGKDNTSPAIRRPYPG